MDKSTQDAFDQVANWMVKQEQINLVIVNESGRLSQLVEVVANLTDVIKQQQDKIAYLEEVVAAMEGYDEDLVQLTIKCNQLQERLEELAGRVDDDFDFLHDLWTK